MGVGKYLKKVRKDKDISLKEIEKETMIRKKYLEDLEKERYDQIPGNAYVKAFIKCYANYIGLEGNRIADIYQKQLDEEKRKENEKKLNKKESFYEKYFSKEKIIILIILIIIIGSIFVFIL